MYKPKYKSTLEKKCIGFNVPCHIGQDFETACKRMQVTRSYVLRKLVEGFLAGIYNIEETLPEQKPVEEPGLGPEQKPGKESNNHTADSLWKKFFGGKK